MTDHQRGDTVSPDHPCITPNLDKLAREGLSFTETHCPSPHCCPSRATFFTGLYPSRHGVWNNVCNDRALSRGLNPGVRLWSDDLLDGGYNLAWSGKWHVSAEEGPVDRGWKELFLTSREAQEHGIRWNLYKDVAAKPDETERGEGQILRPGYGTYTLYGSTGAKPRDQDERAVDEGIGILPELASGDDPWVLYVGTGAPHDPYRVPQKYLDLYDLDDVPLPPSYADNLTDKPRIYQRMRNMRFGQLSEREVREAIRHFWALCTYLDDMFGRLLKALEATGQVDNTIVLYCTDHGDYCGDHGLFAKGIPCFRGAYHVPAVMRYPAGITNPGRHVDELVSLADFAPTFTELALGKSDPKLTGQSLVPFLRDEVPETWRDEIHTQCNGVELYFNQRSVRTKEFKYVFNCFDDDELYDLRSDPHEMTNLAADPKYNDIVKDLMRRIWRFAYEQNDSAAVNYITVSLAPYGPAEAFRD